MRRRILALDLVNNHGGDATSNVRLPRVAREAFFCLLQPRSEKSENCRLRRDNPASQRPAATCESRRDGRLRCLGIGNLAQGAADLTDRLAQTVLVFHHRQPEKALPRRTEA